MAGLRHDLKKRFTGFTHAKFRSKEVDASPTIHVTPSPIPPSSPAQSVRSMSSESVVGAASMELCFEPSVRLGSSPQTMVTLGTAAEPDIRRSSNASSGDWRPLSSPFQSTGSVDSHDLNPVKHYPTKSAYSTTRDSNATSVVQPLPLVGPLKYTKCQLMRPLPAPPLDQEHCSDNKQLQTQEGIDGLGFRPGLDSAYTNWRGERVELRREALQAADAMIREKELLEQDIKSIQDTLSYSFTESTGHFDIASQVEQEPVESPPSKTRKNSTKSALYARLQLVEHESYQLKVENQLMSKKVETDTGLKSEVDVLKKQNKMLCRELGEIDQLSMRLAGLEGAHNQDLANDGGSDSLLIIHGQKPISSSHYIESLTREFELEKIQWIKEKHNLYDRIQNMGEVEFKLRQEVDEHRHQCLILQEECKRAEFSNDALYTSLKQVQKRYQSCLRLVVEKLGSFQAGETQPTETLREQVQDACMAQKQLMNGHEQLSKLQQLYAQVFANIQTQLAGEADNMQTDAAKDANNKVVDELLAIVKPLLNP